MKVLVGGILLLVILVGLVYAANQLFYLFTGTTLMELAPDGTLYFTGDKVACVLEAWGCWSP